MSRLRTGRGASFFAAAAIGSLLLAAFATFCEAEAREPRVIEENGFIVHDLHRSNLRHLATGDFIFRLAEDRATDVVYWAYMGTTEDVIAVLPPGHALPDEAAVRRLMRRVADLPTRVGCGVGTIHRSNVYVVPADFAEVETGRYVRLGPILAEGTIRNDTSGETPTELIGLRIDPQAME